MAKIKSKNTRFEREFVVLLGKTLRRRKIETHGAGIQGTPDIVFRKEKLCIFLDSDFWHGWKYERWKRRLKNDFWRNKIEKNRSRDVKNTRHLRRSGWTVLRLWEHDLKKSPERALARIKERLKGAN